MSFFTKVRIKFIILCLLTVTVSGCIFYPYDQILSPEVKGSIVDAQTQQPIGKATVTVLFPDDYYDNDLDKGVQVMGTAYTGKDGKFTIPAKSERRYTKSLVKGTVVIHGEVVISKKGYFTVKKDCSMMPGAGKPASINYGIIELEKKGNKTAQ